MKFVYLNLACVAILGYVLASPPHSILLDTITLFILILNVLVVGVHL